MEFVQYGSKNNPAVLLLDGGEEQAQVNKVIEALASKYSIYWIRADSSELQEGLYPISEIIALCSPSLPYFYAICCFPSGFQLMMYILHNGLNADYLVAESGMAVSGQEILVAAREWV